MTQPLGNCPGCGGDEPFEQVHPAGQADLECPDFPAECAEWACLGCGAGVFMGTVILGILSPAADAEAVVPHRQSFRAA